MLFVCCWLSVVGRVLCMVCCVCELLGVRCSLFVVRCLLFVVLCVVCCFVFVVARCSLIDASRVLFVV